MICRLSHHDNFLIKSCRNLCIFRNDQIFYNFVQIQCCLLLLCRIQSACIRRLFPFLTGCFSSRLFAHINFQKCDPLIIMIDFEIFRMLGFCLWLIFQADDLRCYFIQFLTCSCRLTAVTAIYTNHGNFFSISSCWCICFCCFRNVYKNRILNLMCCRHGCCHTYNRIILIQFHRNYKGSRASCFGTWIIYISIGFHVLVMRTAECDRCICLATGNCYLTTADSYLSGSTWPWEAVWCVYTIF